jgi:hypothetical protein
VEIDEELTTREERMEDYAERSAKALETLRTYAFIWTLLAVVALLVGAVAYFGN